MRASDAFSWYLERDPVLRSTVVAVAWLDRSPDWPVLVARLEQATRQEPTFRQRVMDVPGRITPPRWTDVDDFDLSWHLCRVAAPSPGDDSVVMDVARREAMTGFDRAHPLWRFTLVEGIDGSRAALVMKIHHSLTDGLGGIQLALLLLDGQRTPGRPPDLPRPPVESPPSGLDLLAEQLGWRASRSARYLARRARSSLPGMVAGIRRPVRAVSSAAGEVASIARTVAPIRQTMSPLMTGRSLRRQLGSLTVPLADLKEASALAGGSVNDGFLASVTAGLRIYHERHGVRVDQLRVTMPISLRTERDRPGGNRITLMRFAVPVGETDPARRVAAMRQLSWRTRHEASLPLTDAIAGALNLLPAAAVTSMLRNVDFLASDVPGFDRPVYLAGAEVERYEAFGPTTGAAVNATLISYNGRCHVGFNLDTAAIPDPEVLVESMRAGFEEVIGMGRRGPAGARPLTGQPAEPPGISPARRSRGNTRAGSGVVPVDSVGDIKGGGSAG